MSSIIFVSLIWMRCVFLRCSSCLKLFALPKLFHSSLFVRECSNVRSFDCITSIYLYICLSTYLTFNHFPAKKKSTNQNRTHFYSVNRVEAPNQNRPSPKFVNWLKQEFFLQKNNKKLTQIPQIWSTSNLSTERTKQLRKKHSKITNDISCQQK